MNTVDNGVSKILEIERIITETELCFKVRFIDYYGREQIKRLMRIDNLENLSWVE